MSGDPDRSEVRQAELVAALSLRIDPGFGQPMEHVLNDNPGLVAGLILEAIASAVPAAS